MIDPVESNMMMVHCSLNSSRPTMGQHRVGPSTCGGTCGAGLELSESIARKSESTLRSIRCADEHAEVVQIMAQAFGSRTCPPKMLISMFKARQPTTLGLVYDVWHSGLSGRSHTSDSPLRHVRRDCCIKEMGLIPSLPLTANLIMRHG